MTAFQFIALVPALPLLAALLVALLHLAGPRAARRGTAHRTHHPRRQRRELPRSPRLDGVALLAGLPGQVHIADWFASGALKLPVSFTLDGLSLGFATLVGFIALVTLKFSSTTCTAKRASIASSSA